MNDVPMEIEALLQEMQGADVDRGIMNIGPQPQISYKQPIERPTPLQATRPQWHGTPSHHAYEPYQTQVPQRTDSFQYHSRVPVNDYTPKRLMESHNGLGSDLQGFDEDLRPEESLVSRVDGGETTFDTDREIGPHCFKNAVPLINHANGLATNFWTPPADITNIYSSPSTIISSPCFGASQRRIVYGSNQRELETSNLSSFPSTRPITRHIPEGSSPRINHRQAPPTIQGIQLIPLSHLPDRFRSVFPFQLFNAIQSKCFDIAYKSNDNLIVSAPTGGGKTAILEVAICRLIFESNTDQYKIVYMAPTKSLCSERQRDWQIKFASLNLKCAEITGDTDQTQLRFVQHASVIITTPEKWDSMTRKWKDHARLMQMVKLFLIDEVHILKDPRGATLEAVVSRMKSAGSKVRFLALSATVPNSEDIAVWLGKDHENQCLPARLEVFGEEFRPVKLQKFVYGLQYGGNDFGFEGVCDPVLPEIITNHSKGKPIMIFCMTRKSTIATAKLLSNLWLSGDPRDRQWPAPSQRVLVQDLELRNTLASGVAFHHAGLESLDRRTVEKGFLEGQISVICCTSTLAVGINLPCHLVIIKNTVSFQDEGLKEYADLEMMQMLGRAGRPQFDDNAIAVIITKKEKVQKYEKLVSGVELLESCLHLNLTDHLNAEIGLGTIFDLSSAKRWLKGSFLFVRLGKNPNHYKINGDPIGQGLDDRVEQICQREIGLLRETDLVSSDGRLRSTEFGDAMARYYIRFGTMQKLLSLQPRARMSEILSALVGAEEFNDVRLRGGEKKLYKEINKSNGLKFPIKVDIALPAHKRTLILQAELGGVEFPLDEQYVKHRKQYQQDKGILFSHINRLTKCLIDCQLYLKDGVTVRNALELLRSFSARVWDNSPYQMKQIPQIGPVAIRKLALGGITSIEALEATEAHRIEMLMVKNPPFGAKLLANLKEFPKLRISLSMLNKYVKRGQPVNIDLKIECGFLNDKTPVTFLRRPIFICLLAERSDGFLIDFRRISAQNFNKEDIHLKVELFHHAQYVTCYVMCDEIAGTMRYAGLKPGLPASVFPPMQYLSRQRQHVNSPTVVSRSDESLLTGGRPEAHPTANDVRTDSFLDDNVEDQDLIEAVNELDFTPIETFDESAQSQAQRSQPQNILRDPVLSAKDSQVNETWDSKQLGNGKWPCNHKCKDKTVCKHLCCREGVEKAPKPPKSSAAPTRSLEDSAGCINRQVLYFNSKSIPKPSRDKTANCDQASERQLEKPSRKNSNKNKYERKGSSDNRKLNVLHNRLVKNPPAPIMTKKEPSFSYVEGDRPLLSFLSKATKNTPATDEVLSEYGDSELDNLPSPSAIFDVQGSNIGPVSAPDRSKEFGAGTIKDDISNPEADAVRDLVRVHDQSERNKNLEEGSSIPNVMTTDFETLPALPTKVIGSRNGEVMISSDSALFCLNDSPEKASLPMKHKLSASSTVEENSLREELVVENGLKFSVSEEPIDPLESGHKAKKRRVSTESDRHVFRASPVGESRSSLSSKPKSPILQASGRPRPAWVNQFDPEFIAEYADFAEFI